ncbi:hypothetical protein [Sporosarcina cyprini]|uniref:hypothetical protein n=1 Tax=Sporosarcina cyprini TaxID=2910523 RepID=UPI001EDD367C|nr:hypothetical protein [Sporosarcina cyprini]MCG3086672.1 hypothetical protein [Sporosarcina cyprini]
MKKIIFYITTFGLALAISFGSINTFAYANSATNSSFTLPNEITEQDVRDFLNKYGVTEEVQDILLEKHYNEQPWDSFAGGVEPVKSYELKTDKGIEMVSVYPDGSVSSTFIAPNISVQGWEGWPNLPIGGNIYPDTILRGSGYISYRDADVFYNAGVYAVFFKANFTITQNGNDFIDRVRDGAAIALGTVPKINKLEIVQPRETLDGPAQAKLSFSIYTGSSSTSWIKLLVGNDTARVISE